MLNVIKELADDNVKFTHILNVKVSNQTSSLVGTKVRQKIFKEIDGVNLLPPNFQFQLVWKSSKTQTSAYYITNSPLNDMLTSQVTGQALHTIINGLQNDYDWTQMGLTYLITKPLMKSIPICNDVIRPTKVKKK